MNLNRLGLVGVAAAAALVGCDSGEGEVVKSTPIEITPANAPAVAAEGVALSEGAMELGGSQGGSGAGSPPVAGELGGNPSGQGGLRGMTLAKVAEVIRKHLEESSIGGIAALSMPLAVQAEPTPEACSGGGTRQIVWSGEGNWDMSYNQCVEQYGSSYGGTSVYYRSVMNGHAAGDYYSYSNGYGGGNGEWSAEYDNFSYDYLHDYNGSTAHSFYLMDGQFNASWTQSNYNTWQYQYGATGLSVQYDYEYPGNEYEDGGSGSGNIVYDNYQFTFNWNGSQSSWAGYLLARDSTRGQWYINTVTPFVTDYCSREITGEVVFSGGYHEEKEYGGGTGNVLHMIGNGDNTVNYDVYNAGGTLISSSTQAWWDAEGGCMHDA